MYIAFAGGDIRITARDSAPTSARERTAGTRPTSQLPHGGAVEMQKPRQQTSLDCHAVPEPRRLDARVGGAHCLVVDVLSRRVEQAPGVALRRGQLGHDDLPAPEEVHDAMKNNWSRVNFSRRKNPACPGAIPIRSEGAESQVFLRT